MINKRPARRLTQWCISAAVIALMAFGAYTYRNIIERWCAVAVMGFMDDDKDDDE